jgi:glycosyltransferase involved in cell wall biosynthesis
MVIPNPIPDIFFYPPKKITSRQKLMIPISEKVILVIASSTVFDTRKGIDLIAPTLEEFVRINGNVTLISVGIQKFQLAIPGVTHKSWGYVNSEIELISLYASADVLFVPSRLDNLPQVITEAQSAGLPVVAFNVGGIQDAILFPDVSAKLVEPYSIEDAAIALSFFCNNSEIPNKDTWVLEAQRKWSYGSINRSFADFLDKSIESSLRAP